MWPEGQRPYPPGMDLGTPGCIWHQDTFLHPHPPLCIRGCLCLGRLAFSKMLSSQGDSPVAQRVKSLPAMLEDLSLIPGVGNIPW